MHFSPSSFISVQNMQECTLFHYHSKYQNSGGRRLKLLTPPILIDWSKSLISLSSKLIYLHVTNKYYPVTSTALESSPRHGHDPEGAGGGRGLVCFLKESCQGLGPCRVCLATLWPPCSPRLPTKPHQQQQQVSGNSFVSRLCGRQEFLICLSCWPPSLLYLLQTFSLLKWNSITFKGIVISV